MFDMNSVRLRIFNKLLSNLQYIHNYILVNQQTGKNILDNIFLTTAQFSCFYPNDSELFKRKKYNKINLKTKLLVKNL